MLRHITNANQYRKIFGWFIDHVDDFDFSSGYYLEFEDADKKRSKLQNAFLWGWVYKTLSEALNDTGESFNGNPYTPILIHAIAQANFRVIDCVTDEEGQQVYIYRSTADMGKKEFSTDIEKINRYFIEKCQVGIPDHRDNEYYSNIAKELGVS